MSRQYAPVVDIIRCAAASMVALFHLGCLWPHGDRALLAEMGYPRITGNDGLFYFGFVGVEIFFVISGYVIASSSVGRSPREFLIGRAMRLIPILWVSVAMALVILAAFGSPLPQLMVRAAGSAFLSPVGPYLDSVVWTLVIEVCFYFAVWVLLVLFGARIAQILPVFAGVLAVASLINLLFEISGYKLGNLIPMLLLLRHGGFFALGILIWSFGSGRQKPGLSTVIAIASCVVEIYAVMGVRNGEAGTQFTFLFPLVVWAIGSALVYYGAMNLKPAASKPVRMAGLMTYPIYLVHQTIGGSVIAVATNALGLPLPVAIVLGVGAIIGVSWGLVALVEPRLRPGFSKGLELLIPRSRAVPA